MLLPLQIPFVLWQGRPREHSINQMGSGACQRGDVLSKTWWWIGSEARGGLVLLEASGTSPPWPHHLPPGAQKHWGFQPEQDYTEFPQSLRWLSTAESSLSHDNMG